MCKRMILAALAFVSMTGCDFVLPIEASAVTALVAAILALLNQGGVQ